MPAEPIPFTTTRFRCPFCSRGNAKKSRTREHIGRCWQNPEARGCKTCKHFEPYCPEWSDNCEVGVDLSPVDTDEEYRKGGPIVGCDRWKAKS